ncbi:non-canonical purine NTP pyrophosphatase [Candidatus Curtissbacteria bacterium]|nr:non-canonical purine NTP pyrophosphatase [Candidatus Curtissbacteria bacterium]
MSSLFKKVRPSRKNVATKKVGPLELKLPDLVVVTTNPDKLAEINEILGTGHKVSKIDVPEIQSLDLDEVITHKAKEAYKRLKKPVLVEDISFEIDALKGLPGTLIKFFMQTLGPQGTAKLIRGKNRGVTTIAAVAIYDGLNLKIFKGKVRGSLTTEEKGKSGFFFDKIFIPDGYNQTYAQMPPSLKNKISHRAKALLKVKEYLLSF